MTERDGDGASPMPILIALGVALVVLAVVGITWLLSDQPMSEDLKVSRAAIGQNDALQRGSYPDFRKYTCAAQQGTEAEVLARQQKSTATQGARYVDDVTGVAIDGDRATATVVYHFERAPDDKIKAPMTFTREDGEWTVCSPGPM
ncbi:lumazine-binding protein [Mycobacterium sp. CVI_P3]|uniref:Lumazine-binding protein n=1 Tax=Mycobacterium pinniadriaticum TaxID=2994102 RepID=A0ABT3SI69_9MYCO|nr:lumazine-binding protein [Mycobacterium pinniadriaticum]MCX2932725.1 lumazine-binding protein [Mycobacterium pinniadriaticum]MCX2939215.1 lumazine-binding protein [Mycobacterium pinniadriaticum]